MCNSCRRQIEHQSELPQSSVVCTVTSCKGWKGQPANTREKAKAANCGAGLVMHYIGVEPKEEARGKQPLNASDLVVAGMKLAGRPGSENFISQHLSFYS